MGDPNVFAAIGSLSRADFINATAEFVTQGQGTTKSLIYAESRYYKVSQFSSSSSLIHSRLYYGMSDIHQDIPPDIPPDMSVITVRLR